MAKPTDDIEFATDGAALVSDPGGTKKKLGFLVSEKPPAHWFDWLFRAYWRWISWLTLRQNNSQLMNWQLRNAPIKIPRTTVCWSPSLKLFCSVAFAGTAAQQVITSPDGLVWTQRTSSSARMWISVCWSDTLSLFCAICAGGSTTGQIMTSPDGFTWSPKNTPVSSSWKSICWSSSLGLFCAVADSGTTSEQILTSPDGTNWTARVSPNAIEWNSVCWSPEKGLFCAVADTGTAAQQIMTSPDGINWTSRTAPSARSWTAVCWSPELNLFCAVATDGTVAQRVMTSADGITWVHQTATSATYWTSVCWSPERGVFCALANTGVMISYDGVKWYPRIIPHQQQWQNICWAPEIDTFCAVSFDGAIMISDLRYVGSENVRGTTTNDDAPAGQIGEYVVSFRDYTTGLTLASGTPQAPALLALTAGDWDVTGVCGFYGNGGAITGTVIRTAVTLTAPGSGFPSSALLGDSVAESNVMPNASGSVILPVPSVRVTLASSQTVYLQALSYFSAGTNKAYGRLSARRVR